LDRGENVAVLQRGRYFNKQHPVTQLMGSFLFHLISQHCLNCMQNKKSKSSFLCMNLTRM